MTAAFPFTLPGLDALSTEWVMFSLLWSVVGVLTFARFIGLLGGVLPARLATSQSSMSLGVPGIMFVFVSMLAHFAVVAAILAEVTSADGVLAGLKLQIQGVLGPLGGLMEGLLPPLAAIGRLHWSLLPVAALPVIVTEVLLRSALATADSVRKHKQSDVLQGIAKKAADIQSQPDRAER